MSEPDISALKETVTSAIALIQQFTFTLKDPPTASPNLPADPPEPLSVVHDCAKLIKAHTTKLSLLMINKPFTPSAIQKIIAHDLNGTCLPALMSAVEICRPSYYGRVMHLELKARVGRLMRELESLLEEVQVLANERAVPSNGRTLTSVGVVWESVDSLMELKNIGLGGLLVEKVTQYREMLEDALQELKEWSEDVEEDDDAGNEADEKNETERSDDEDSIERMLTSTNKLPKDRKDLMKTLETSFRRLKLIITLYRALVKRRFTKVNLEVERQRTAGIGIPFSLANKVDKSAELLKQIPEDTDEMAGAFYELDDTEANKILSQLMETCKSVLDLLYLDWTDQSDEFTSWSVKWTEAMKSI